MFQFNKHNLLLVAFVALTTLMAAAPAPTPKHNTIRLADLKVVRENLQLKALKGDLNTQGQKALRKLDHKITKWDKQNEKRVKRGQAPLAEKSKGTAAVLAFFLGALGIHRFYLGYSWQGVVQLLTAGGLGIWFIVDFVRILMGKLKPKTGDYK